MTTLLAIDTATDHCSVALLANGNMTTRTHQGAREHTDKLLVSIDELCREQACAISQLDAIALTIGPGSFTGLRIGLATAQGLAYGHDLPLIGVDTLESMASMQYKGSPYEGLYVAMIDARMGDLVFATIAFAHGELSVVEPSKIAPLKQVTEYLDRLDEPFALIGSGAQLVDITHPTLAFIDYNARSHASTVIDLALANHMPGQPLNTLVPRYFRDEINWQKRLRIRSATTD
ncbi:tRNA (adenosine(37)-N6)-threonylcarbamoyltransferase complex dimerization subunit type 1 TsaB [bacterium]|nr:tRNA (adenosine(37)-N6)-threonylcarbamoyltransferase complex dimerization subunit type 1 TsaB [bacterium]